MKKPDIANKKITYDFFSDCAAYSITTTTMTSRRISFYSKSIINISNLKSWSKMLANLRARRIIITALVTTALALGMISHKKSLITIFRHKHKIKNFIKNLIFFIKKFSTVFDFGLYLEKNCKFWIKITFLKND